MHGGPGALRAGKGLAGFGEGLLACTEGLAAGGQLAIGFAPGAVDRQQHTVGERAADLLLRVAGAAGAEREAEQDEREG